MGLPDFSVRRPVTTVMIFTGVVILGIISLNRLPQELYPPITYPQLSVVANYENAAPEEVELLITRPIEEAVATVPNIKSISSISKEGTSLVMAEFNWGTNMDFAALGMREKIDLIKGRLPRDSEEPIVMKFNPFELPIIILSITGAEGPQELLAITKKVIKDELEKIEGVASCSLSGGLEREILVEIDQGRLQASGISLLTILDALNKSNINYPAGTIKESLYEYLIRTMGEYQKVSDIKDTVIEVEDRKEAALKELKSLSELEQESAINKKEGLKRFILLSDIGEIRDTLKEKTSISRYNGSDNISLSIQKQAGSFTLQVADKVKKTLKDINQNLPKDVRVKIVYDQSLFIRQSIKGVRDAAVQGGILAFLVLVIFLKNLWLSAVVITITPISILACFSLMYFRGITLNMMSLGGMAIGVGMLIDNAIVVVESIFRYRKQGFSAKEAAVVGSNEVIAPMIASTLTTICVFFPMVFVIGIAGQLFKELAWVVIVTQVVSLIIAFMLIPCLVSQIKGKAPVKKIEKPIDAEDETGAFDALPKNRFWEFIGKPVDLIENVYSHVIEGFLRHRFLYMLIILAVFFFSISRFSIMDKEFMPKIDQGQFVIKMDLSPGTKLSMTDAVVKKIENLLLTDAYVEEAALNIGSSRERAKGEGIETLGSHQAQIMVNLRKERRVSTSDFIQSLKDKLSQIDLSNAEIQYIVQESALKTAFESSAPVVLEIKGPDIGVLRTTTNNIQVLLKRVGGLYGVKHNLAESSPETKIWVLKDRASSYGISVKDMAATAQVALKGYIATKFKESGKEIDIRVRLRKEDRRDISKIGNILLSAPSGMQLPLKEVAYIGIGRGPSEIRRMNQQRTVLVTANVYKRSLNEVQDELNKLLSSFKIPKGYSITLTGETEKMKESFNSLMFALALAVLLVYMIMAAQFESLWQPFLIMFTIPLSLIGIVWTLHITHTALSVVVLLGIIMQGGIVVNNGIILIDYTNILRNRGIEVYDAAIRAGKVRLRPILMTASTSIIGLLPLALGLSEGSELDAPLAKTTMGGLLSATFLTLLVIPALYLSSSRIMESIFKKRKGAPVDILPKLEEETVEPPPVEETKEPLPGLEKPIELEPELEEKEEPQEKTEEPLSGELTEQPSLVPPAVEEEKTAREDKLLVPPVEEKPAEEKTVEPPPVEEVEEHLPELEKPAEPELEKEKVLPAEEKEKPEEISLKELPEQLPLVPPVAEEEKVQEEDKLFMPPVEEKPIEEETVEPPPTEEAKEPAVPELEKPIELEPEKEEIEEKPEAPEETKEPQIIEEPKAEQPPLEVKEPEIKSEPQRETPLEIIPMEPEEVGLPEIKEEELPSEITPIEPEIKPTEETLPPETKVELQKPLEITPVEPEVKPVGEIEEPKIETEPEVPPEIMPTEAKTSVPEEIKLLELEEKREMPAEIIPPELKSEAQIEEIPKEAEEKPLELEPEQEEKEEPQEKPEEPPSQELTEQPSLVPPAAEEEKTARGDKLFVPPVEEKPIVEETEEPLPELEKPEEPPPQELTEQPPVAPPLPEEKVSEEDKLFMPPVEEKPLEEEKELAKRTSLYEGLKIYKEEKYIKRLNKRQRRALEYLKQYGTVTRKDYAKIFKTSIPTAARDLKDLTGRGLIVGRGPLAVGRYYELVKKDSY
jgi:HAE1 family hydrophobic/amphiphilic exporter-1